MSPRIVSPKKESKKFIYRFELGLGGLFGVGIVSFCVFLWMFLLGIWAGQTVLQSSDAIMSVPRPSGFAAKLTEAPATETAAEIEMPKELVEEERPEERAADLATAEAPGVVQPEPAMAKETSFFSLQIGAYHNPEGAKTEMEKWRAQGYDAFLRSPQRQDDKFTRVYIGRFENLADANQKAVKLEEEENLKAFIALLTNRVDSTP